MIRLPCDSTNYLHRPCGNVERSVMLKISNERSTACCMGALNFFGGNSTQVQRRSYFLAGVGYETGRQLDAVSQQGNLLLVQANAAIAFRDHEGAITSITALAELIFPIQPFVPAPLPENWRDILRAWLLGIPLADLANDDGDVLRFVENGLVYVLPWGMEALRVRAIASNDIVDSGFALTMDNYETGLAVPALETGSLNRSAALLMQAGFNSRTAAIKAITDTEATFENSEGLRTWLASEGVTAHTAGGNWPTIETAEIWRGFLQNFEPPDRSVWKDWDYIDTVNWRTPNLVPPSGSPVRIVLAPDRQHHLVVSPDHVLLGTLAHPLNSRAKGLIRATVALNQHQLSITYVGPADLVPNQTT